MSVSYSYVPTNCNKKLFNHSSKRTDKIYCAVLVNLGVGLLDRALV